MAFRKERRETLVSRRRKLEGPGTFLLEGTAVASGNFPEEVPDFLVSFNPVHIWFRGSAPEGGPRIVFGWGGPLAHWGLVVGLPDMPMPEENPIHDGSETEFRRPIKPGVYVFDRG